MAASASEFTTPEKAWVEEGGGSLEDLYQAPEALLNHPQIFLSGWVGVQESTAYILVSPMESSIAVRPHEDAPQGGFVYRLRNGEYGAVMPGQLAHSPPPDQNLRRKEEPGGSLGGG